MKGMRSRPNRVGIALYFVIFAAILTHEKGRAVGLGRGTLLCPSWPSTRARPDHDRVLPDPVHSLILDSVAAASSCSSMLGTTGMIHFSFPGSPGCGLVQAGLQMPPLSHQTPLRRQIFQTRCRPGSVQHVTSFADLRRSQGPHAYQNQTLPIRPRR